MSHDGMAAEARSRRHVIRIAAGLGAAAALSAIPTQKAQAGGRHSDPFYCEPVCLARGTLIETASGDIAIENLQRGDLIRTADGSFQKVRWIGRRAYRRADGAAWSVDVDPVRVSASALAPNVPSRDLYLSPKHALYIDGYLMPAKFLINGATIRQGVYDEHEVEYFHVECETHQVMFAHNCAVETFRLQDHYEGFSNFAEHARLFGDEASPVEPYAPVLGYWTLGDDAKALLRSLTSTCIDVRDPIHVAYDRIAARAEEVLSNA